MNGLHKVVKLTRGQLEYLTRADFLPADLVTILETARTWNEKTASVSVSREAAEAFRSAFTGQLAKVGFDADDEPNREGRELEELIDRFYAG